MGALWDYGSFVGTDNILSVGELSGARTLKFNNPNNETFTVTFNVIGNLANPGNGSSSSSSRPSGGGGSGRSRGTSTGTGSRKTITSLVLRVSDKPPLYTFFLKFLGANETPAT